MLLGTGLIVATSVAAGATIGTGINQKLSNKRIVRAAFMAACLSVAGASGVLMAQGKPVHAAQTLVVK